MEASELCERLVGKEHTSYASSRGALAGTYLKLGNYSKALELHQEALGLYEKLVGKEHPDYARSLNNLAQTYSNLGDYTKALELQQQTISELLSGAPVDMTGLDDANKVVLNRYTTARRQYDAAKKERDD